METSAFLRAFLNEEKGDEVRKRLDRAKTILASRLLRLEAERTVLRLAESGRMVGVKRVGGPRMTNDADLAISLWRAETTDGWGHVGPGYTEGMSG